MTDVYVVFYALENSRADELICIKTSESSAQLYVDRANADDDREPYFWDKFRVDEQ